MSVSFLLSRCQRRSRLQARDRCLRCAAIAYERVCSIGIEMLKKTKVDEAGLTKWIIMYGVLFNYLVSLWLWELRTRVSRCHSRGKFHVVDWMVDASWKKVLLWLYYLLAQVSCSLVWYSCICSLQDFYIIQNRLTVLFYYVPGSTVQCTSVCRQWKA